MLECEATLVARIYTHEDKTYERFWIYVPSKIVKDSQFPFEAGQTLNIEVDLQRKAVVLSETSPPKVAPRKRRRR